MDLTVRDAARLLNTTENAIYRWIHDGTLPSYRVNEKYRLNRVELLEWATGRNLKVSPEIFQESDDVRRPQGLLADALTAGGAFYDVQGTDKASVLKSLCGRLALPEEVKPDDLYAVLMARETLGSTGIGNGIAVPHPRSPLILNVKTPSVSLAFLKQPIDFGAMDRKPVDCLFTIISTTIRLHLHLLSHLMHALQDAKMLELLRQRRPLDQIVGKVREIESRLDSVTAEGTR
jgi:PTS system nitrogen regulatory IIA component